MNDKEMDVWFSFVVVMENVSCNKKSDVYETLVPAFLTAFHDLGWKICVQLHSLYSHINRFLENLGEVTDEQCELFHQELKTM